MKILLLAAHPDDIEFSMGATVSKLIREKHEIYLFCFCDCEIKDEFRNAMKVFSEIRVLGFYDYKVRTLPIHRQQVLEIFKNTTPFKMDIVYLPCSFDIHQDHQVIHNEGVRAFKHSTIFGYSFAWNNISEDLRHFEIVTKEDVELKLKAIDCYKSQENRYYHNVDFIMSQIKNNGKIINQNFAERFEIIRQIK